jgi:hypothetical protein
VSKLTRPGRYGGWGGIRTLETLARLPVFKTGAFNHSATHPQRFYPRQLRNCHRVATGVGLSPFAWSA